MASLVTLGHLLESRRLLLQAQASVKLINLVDAEFDNQVDDYKAQLSAGIDAVAVVITTIVKKFNTGELTLREFTDAVHRLRTTELNRTEQHLDTLNTFLATNKNVI